MNESAMTQGSIWKLVIKMAMPMVIAQIVNMLYNIVDRIFVGHIAGVGTIALGGVGIYLPISIIIMAVSLWIGAGGAPKAAIQLGKGNRLEAERIMGCCILPIFLLGIVITILLWIFGSEILPLFGATDANLPFALSYLNTMAFGIVCFMLSMGLNTFINTQGKTLMGMISILSGAIVNIILGAVFIFGLRMGVEGAALATVLSQIVSCIWVIGFLVSKKSIIRIRQKYLIPDLKLLGEITLLGLATFITTAVESIVTIVLNLVLKKYGADALTGYSTDGSTLAISVSTIITMASSFILMPINGFTQGIQPVISYNYGAGRNDRVKRTIAVSCIICTCYAAVICAVLIVAPQLFIRLFTADSEIILLTGSLLRIYISGMVLLGIQSTLQQSFVSRGLAGYSIGIALVRKVLYVPLLFILPVLTNISNSITAIYIAEPVSDAFAALITIVLYFITVKTLSKDQDVVKASGTVALK